MTKKEIVKAISEELGLTQLKTKEVVQKTFDAIVEALITNERIELRNFGVFEVRKRAARKARNPRTGGQVEVPAKYVVTFKPGKKMEERVRQLEEAHSSLLESSPPEPTTAVVPPAAVSAAPNSAGAAFGPDGDSSPTELGGSPASSGFSP